MSKDELNPEQDITEIEESAKGKDKKKAKPKDETIARTRFSYAGYHYAEFSDNAILKFYKYREGYSDVVSSVEISDPESILLSTESAMFPFGVSLATSTFLTI